jgi:hypothetical protein
MPAVDPNVSGFLKQIEPAFESDAAMAMTLPAG